MRTLSVTDRISHKQLQIGINLNLKFEFYLELNNVTLKIKGDRLLTKKSKPNLATMIVYRYVDKNTDEIKYVGIVHGKTRSLKQRVAEHKRKDEWTNESEWTIQYIDLPKATRTDVEYLEAHLISLYETYNWYNKSKSSWGVSEFLPRKFDWMVYRSNKPKIQKTTVPSKKLQKQQERIDKLNSLIDFYKEERKIATYSHQIKRRLKFGMFKECGVQGYIRVCVSGDIGSATSYKSNFETGKSKYDSVIADVIDISNAKECFDGTNNIMFVLHKSIVKHIDSNIRSLDILKDICIEKICKIFKEEDVQREYIQKLA